MAILQIVKEAGLKNLNGLIKPATEVSYQTLKNWRKSKPKLFALLIERDKDKQRIEELEKENEILRSVRVDDE